MSLDQDPDSLLPPRADSTPERQPVVFRRPPKVITVGDESPLAPIGRAFHFVLVAVGISITFIVCGGLYLSLVDTFGLLISGIWTCAVLLAVLAYILWNRLPR